MLLRLTVVLAVLALVPVAAAGADPGTSVTGDAAQSQYGGTPPQPVPEPAGDVQTDAERGEDVEGRAEEVGPGDEDAAPGEDVSADEDAAPGAAGDAGGRGGADGQAVAEVRDVARGTDGGTLPFTGAAALLGLGAGALLLMAGVATRRLSRAA